MKLTCVLFALLFLLWMPARSQHIDVLTSGTATSIRGLSVVSDQVAWVSGSHGQVGKSCDRGKTWRWFTVPGFEQRDFRDIQAFDTLTAIIIAVAEPTVILKTTDGGTNWKAVFTDTTKGMFLDAMDFAGKVGVVVGDPIAGKLFVAFTEDSGNTWQRDTDSKHLEAGAGEAFFAASGSNIKLQINSVTHKRELFMTTGGLKSRLFLNGKPMELPIIQGHESTGANSIDVWGNHAVIVGGDFSKDSLRTGNCILVDLGKKIRMTVPVTPPHGYRSCVVFMSNDTLVACGTSGVDVSYDAGLNWQMISRESFHVCGKAPNSNILFLAGNAGRVARLTF